MTTTTSAYALCTAALYAVAAVGAYIAWRVIHHVWTGGALT